MFLEHATIALVKTALTIKVAHDSISCHAENNALFHSLPPSSQPSASASQLRQAGCISISDGIVHFLLPGFPATPPRSHNHPQLGGITPTDGAVKGLLRLGYIGPHGGLAGA